MQTLFRLTMSNRFATLNEPVWSLSGLPRAAVLIWRRAGLLSPAKPSQKRLFVARALRDPISVGRWLEFLEEFERTHRLPPAIPQVSEKPARFYALDGIPIRQRVALLRDHYTLASAILPRKTFETIWSGGKIELGSMTGRSGRRYQLYFGAADVHTREGEVCFCLHDAQDDSPLARLTFLLTTHRNTPVPLIGGLQGPKPDANAKARIIAATRDLSGLRPKMAVFIALAAFAESAGAGELRAVSNRTHSKNGERSSERANIHSDYDSFWLERGGTPTDIGFSIPLGLAPKAARSGRNAQRAEVIAFAQRLFDPEWRQAVFDE